MTELITKTNTPKNTLTLAIFSFLHCFQIQINIYNIENMKSSCSCEHHHQQAHHQHSKIDQIITLLQDNFISPYKILYLLDPKQADYFKLRNESSGCCASNHITISNDKLTQTEKMLKECISSQFLLRQLDGFLSSCNQKYRNIVQSGRKDNLQVTPEVQKFLVDKVIMESINHLIYTTLSKRIKEESISKNMEIGLWATPATWFSKYPNQPLDFIPGKMLNCLLSKNWGMTTNYISNEKELIKELSILEKDGKFEQSKWFLNHKAKILNNPQKFIDIKASNNSYLFSEMRQLIIKLSSIPFQLNAKANLYCTVSPNLHVYYSKDQFVTQKLKGQLKYTVILNAGGSVKIDIEGQQIELSPSSLLIIDNKKLTFSIKSVQQELFLFFNYLGCVEKK